MITKLIIIIIIIKMKFIKKSYILSLLFLFLIEVLFLNSNS